jgi:hypothetical protein
VLSWGDALSREGGGALGLCIVSPSSSGCWNKRVRCGREGSSCRGVEAREGPHLIHQCWRSWCSGWSAQGASRFRVEGFVSSASRCARRGACTAQLLAACLARCKCGAIMLRGTLTAAPKS